METPQMKLESALGPSSRQLQSAPQAAVSWSQLPLSKLILENLPYSMQLLDGLPFVFPSPVVFPITETSHFSIAVHLYTLNSLVEIRFFQFVSSLALNSSYSLLTASLHRKLRLRGFNRVQMPSSVSLTACLPTYRSYSMHQGQSLTVLYVHRGGDAEWSWGNRKFVKLTFIPEINPVRSYIAYDDV